MNKKTFNISSIFILTMILLACGTTARMDNSWRRNFNGCKILKDDVLIYPVFVEEKRGAKWLQEEKKAFLDSLKVSTNWILSQSKAYNVNLNFIIEAHPNAIAVGLPGKNIAGAYNLASTNLGLAKINKHYDNAAKKLARAIKRSKIALPPYIYRIKTKDQVIAKLRNNFQVESVVLLFIHKPEKNNNVFFSLNTLSNKTIEYGVNSFNKPSLMAFQILELFGATSFNFDVKKKRKEKIMKHIDDNFPNDIMAKPFQTLSKSTTGTVTDYLIGWTPEIDPVHQILMEGGKIKILKK